jgi:hypothetical protein
MDGKPVYATLRRGRPVLPQASKLRRVKCGNGANRLILWGYFVIIGQNMCSRCNEGSES